MRRGLVPFGKNMNNIERIFDMMFQGFHEDFELPVFSNGMKVDIQDNEKEYIVEADIPGASKEQIHIDYHNDYLTLSVENIQEVKDERANYIRKERKVGRTSRTLYVANVQEDAIKAKYEHGVLKVVLPKDSSGKSRQKKIQIQ